MRTENQMLELVRDKIRRRRRRRRTAAASAGGGVAALLLAVVVLAGGAGRPGAVEDVRTGPGEVTSSTPATAPEGASSSTTTTTTVPAPGGAGASGAATGDGDGGGGPAGGGPTTTPDGSPVTTTVDGSLGDLGDDVVHPPDTTTTTEPAPTTEAPFWRQWEQPLYAEEGDLQMNATLRRWDPGRPDILEVTIHFDDPTGTMVHNHGRMGPGVVLAPEGGSPITWGDPEPPCGADDNYTVEPVHFDETVEISIGPGEQLGFRIVTLPCMPEVDVIDFVTEIPTPTP